MERIFRIGIGPDLYTDAKGEPEKELERMLGGADGVEYSPVQPLTGNVATPETLNEFDGFFALGTAVTAQSLKGVERLAIIARWGVGYDRIDVPALTEAGVLLTINPKAVRRPVAEAILALIFALSKNLFLQDRITRGGAWRRGLSMLGQSVGGRVLGSVGCGNIGREMFRLSRSLGFARMIACDPHVRQEDVTELGVELVDIDTVFRESDYVAVNTFLNEQTTGLVGERHFRLMKPTAFFINTARGPIVQHEALVKALKEKWIRGAGIDVFPEEPPTAGEPLFQLDNVILAPHAIAWTEELMRDNTVECCENLLTFARGQLPQAIVNRDVLSNPKFQRKLTRLSR
jgi:phosphoglycerate dehydrogenase-like enzyme